MIIVALSCHPKYTAFLGSGKKSWRYELAGLSNFSLPVGTYIYFMKFRAFLGIKLSGEPRIFSINCECSRMLYCINQLLQMYTKTNSKIKTHRNTLYPWYIAYFKKWALNFFFPPHMQSNRTFEDFLRPMSHVLKRQVLAWPSMHWSSFFYYICHPNLSIFQIFNIFLNIQIVKILCMCIPVY